MTASTASARPPADFQLHLAELERQGLLIRIDRPINKDTELHPLVRWQFLGGATEDERKAFMFTNVVDSNGRKYDMPVVVGALAASPRIYAVGMGQAVEDIGNAWSKAISHPIEPRVVDNGPCQEVVITGEALRERGGGLAALPVPVSTPGFDSAPYLTATMCITQDPESLVRNVGMYRAALKATDRMVVRMVARPGGAGGWIHWQKYRERGEKMPIAIAIGAAPVVVFTSPQKLRPDVDEFAVSGGLAGAPVDLVKCKTIDLLVPANAEIVIEGLIDTSVLEPEAPFGESNGYVALEAYNMPMQVTAITRKRNAVFSSIISQVTPSESSVIKKVAYEPMFLNHLAHTMAIKGIKKVVLHEPLTNLRPVIFLQFAYGTPRTEVWRGLYGATSFQAGIGKVAIAVSDDIDPSSVDAILWSIAYRSKPSEDVHVAPNRGPVQGAQYSGTREDSTLLIDATRKGPLPPLALPTREFMENARKIWDELGLPPFKNASPWHGYTLGNWHERWDLFAQRAVAGDWEQSGIETLARQIGDVEPETSVERHAREKAGK